MDPLSALLLAIMASGMTVQTVSSGLADARAARQGRTPPSKQQFNQRQDERAARGQSRHPDPGPWRRRWQNIAEAHAERQSPKHDAKLEHIRDNAGNIKERHRRKLERRAQRRAQLGSILAGWGKTSWNAVQDAHEGRLEKRAWEENTRRDQEGTGANLAPVVPLPRRSQEPSPYDEEGVSPADIAERGGTCLWGMEREEGPCGAPTVYDSGHCWEHLHPNFKGGKTGTGGNTGTLSPEQQALVDRWRSELANSNGQPKFGWFSTEEWYSLPEWARNQMITEARDAGYAITPRTESGQIAEVGDSRMDPRYGRLRITETSDGQVKFQSGRDVESNTNIYGNVLDPSTWQGTDRHGRDIQTGIGPSRDATALGGIPSVVHNDDMDGLLDDTSPERKAVLRHREGSQEYAPSNDDNTDNTKNSTTSKNTDTTTPEGPHIMSHSGEITDLASAISYFQATQDYCDQISGVFEASLAQARTAADDLQTQAAALETAQSSLTGQGMDGDIQTRIAQLQERFAGLTQQMQQIEEGLSATQEEISSARSDATDARDALEAQTGIAEQLQSQQANGVASNTDFYTNA